MDNKENTILIKKILEDFKNIIIYLNKVKGNEKNRLKEKSSLYDCSLFLEDNISDNFKQLFKESDITISKTTNLLEYYLMLIYPTLSKELLEIKVEIPKDKINEINKYFYEKHLIDKDIFAFSIRLFISTFLSEVKNKANKIKKNSNTIVNYLDIPDIWKKNVYNKSEFKQELNQIKNLKIQLNQIYSLSEIIGGDIDDNYFLDLKMELKRREDEKKAQENEAENKEEKNEKNQEEEEEEDDYYKKVDDDDDDDYGGRY